MLIILMRPNLVGVDGVFYHVSLEGLDDRVEMLQYNTQSRQGRQFFRPEVKTSVSVRDLDTEKKLLEDAQKNNLPLGKLQPVYRAVDVQRPDEPLENFDHQPFYDKWLVAKAEQKKARESALATLRAAQPKAAGGEG